MARQIVIDLDFGVGKQPDIHRIRNFGEVLYHIAKEDGWMSISLHEVDRATNKLCVNVLSARRLRRISAKIEKLLDRHGFTGVARLSEVNSPN